jgi:glycosyltransferase involved in cell wall biosynthesis
VRILYVAAGTPVPGTHGGSTHALELCRALVRGGHDVDLVALPSEGANDEIDGESATDEIDGVRLHYLERAQKPPQLEWTSYGEVLAIGEAVSPDIVVERFYTFGGTGLRTARKIGVPSVLEVNSPARSYPGSLRDRLDALTLLRPIDRWRRRMLEMATAYYATGACLLPPELQDRVRVVVNGVDCSRFRPATERPIGPLRGIYVSSFRPWHGAEDLVDAVARCRDEGVEVRLTCVGDGPTRSAAARLAGARGLSDRVRFLGAVPRAEVPELLASAEVGLAPFSPARHRALELGWFWSPIKIFEYLAAGLAVITTDTPEVASLLTPACALLYPPGDVDELARRLQTLAADRDRAKSMGEAGRGHVCSRYTWDHQAAVVAEVLEEALAAYRRRRRSKPSGPSGGR